MNMRAEWINVNIRKVVRKYSSKTSTVRPTTAAEIPALLGILVFSGYRREDHSNTEELW